MKASEWPCHGKLGIFLFLLLFDCLSGLFGFDMKILVINARFEVFND